MEGIIELVLFKEGLEKKFFNLEPVKLSNLQNDDGIHPLTIPNS